MLVVEKWTYLLLIMVMLFQEKPIQLGHLNFAFWRVVLLRRFWIISLPMVLL
jgi:hypothetical protein